MFTLRKFSDVWISPNVPVDLASALSDYEKASAKTPDAYTTYAEFEAAQAATTKLGAAFTKIVHENGRNPDAAAAIALIKSNLREPTALKQAADAEYKTRVKKAEDELQYVEKEIRKRLEAIGDQHNRMLVLYKSAADAKKKIEKGDSAGLKDGLVQMAAGAKAVEEGVPAEMITLRGDPRVQNVRLRGAEGICTDNAVGGKDFVRLGDFKSNMALFKQVEEKAKVATSLATVTKQYIKACVVLLATDKTKAEKTAEIMAKLVKKVDQAIDTGRNDISKNHNNPFKANAPTEANRKTLEDLASIIADKSKNIPNRVTAIKILIKELSDVAPGSAKAEEKSVKEKLAAFEKDVETWLKTHKKIAAEIDELLKGLDKAKKKK